MSLCTLQLLASIAASLEESTSPKKFILTGPELLRHLQIPYIKRSIMICFNLIMKGSKKNISGEIRVEMKIFWLIPNKNYHNHGVILKIDQLRGISPVQD